VREERLFPRVPIERQFFEAQETLRRSFDEVRRGGCGSTLQARSANETDLRDRWCGATELLREMTQRLLREVRR
jgi:hypothetical protein